MHDGKKTPALSVIFGIDTVFGMAMAEKCHQMGHRLILLTAAIDSELPDLKFLEQADYIFLSDCMRLQSLEILQTELKKNSGIDNFFYMSYQLSLYRTCALSPLDFQKLHTHYITAWQITLFLLPYMNRAHSHMLFLTPPLLQIKGGQELLNPEFTVPGAAVLGSVSLMVKGLSCDHYWDNIAVNGLWPRCLINYPGLMDVFHNRKNLLQGTRKANIIAEAACRIINKPVRVCTGSLLIDDLVLASHGIEDFSSFRSIPADQAESEILYRHPLSPVDIPACEPNMLVEDAGVYVLP